MQKKEMLKSETRIATISKDKFLKVYNPENCLAFSRKLQTIDKAIDAKAPTLGSIKRDFGGNFQQSFVMVWLVYLNEMLNLNKPMNETQIKLCATQLLNDFSHLKISDLTLIYKRIITGQYGELYESLSIAKLMTFVGDYDAERTEYSVMQTQREHREFRYKESKNESDMDLFKRKLKKIYR